MTSGRSRRSSVPVTVCCSFEIAVLDHPGELDDAFELKLAPPAANTRALERVDQPRRLGAQTLARRVERRDALHQLRAGFDTPALGVLDLAVHLLERLLQRREQTFNRHLPRVDIGSRLVPRLPQPGFGQVEKPPVVRVERLGAQRLERVAEGCLGFLVGPQAFILGRPISFRGNLQTGMRRPTGEPPHEGTEPQTNRQNDQL